MSADTTWPPAITEFERFLFSVGLQLERRDVEAAFGNKLLLYVGERLTVRVVSDRGIWFIEVTNAKGGAGNWYDAAIIRDLFGSEGEAILSLEQQISFIEDNWLGINNCFGPSAWQQTSARLSFLREERTKRRIPGLFSPPKQIN
jgi:hypothetical protein